MLFLTPSAGSKSTSWMITGGSLSNESHIEDWKPVPFDSDDIPFSDFEGPGTSLALRLKLARTGGVGSLQRDIETLGRPRFPCDSPGVAEIR